MVCKIVGRAGDWVLEEIERGVLVRGAGELSLVVALHDLVKGGAHVVVMEPEDRLIRHWIVRLRKLLKRPTRMGWTRDLRDRLSFDW